MTHALSQLDRRMSLAKIGWLDALGINSAIDICARLATHYVPTAVLVGHRAKHPQEVEG